MKYYPVSLKMTEKLALVVGAGAVAERKVRGLLACGACVRVVAPRAVASLKRLDQLGQIDLRLRPFKSSDLVDAYLVIAATSDRYVNETVCRHARQRGLWINVVDHTASCEFISPAVIRRHGLVIAVSTDGKNPPLSKKFKAYLEEKIDEFSGVGDKL